MKAGASTLWASWPATLRPTMIAASLPVVVLLGVGAGFGVHRLTASAAETPAIAYTRFGMHGEAAWAAGTQPAPMIDTLRDQTGMLFSLASLRGRSVAIVFLDSHCHQECPLEGRALAAAESPHPVNGDIEHTEAVYLVDRRGYMRSGYMYPFLPRFVTDDPRALATGEGS
jgi:cytochrome oxidase Cu insertion factor (SCO1/SenC/PrrC family)